VYDVHLTATELKRCIASDVDESALQIIQWRVVNVNSFELPAAFANFHGGETGPFWNFFEKCCRAMDDTLAPDNFIHPANGTLGIVDLWQFTAGDALCGPVITSMDCYQYGPEWKPVIWRWIMNGERYDHTLPSLKIQSPLLIEQNIWPRLQDWLHERGILLHYPPYEDGL